VVMAMTTDTRSAWADFMEDARERVQAQVPLETRGTLTRLTGLVLEARASGCRWVRSAWCRCRATHPSWPRWWGFLPTGLFDARWGHPRPVQQTSVVPAAHTFHAVWPRARCAAGVLRLPMGDGLLRVVDSRGLPLDHGGPVQTASHGPPTDQCHGP
jgi:flagellum-specific ATP synthase